MSLKAPKRIRKPPPPTFMKGGRSEALVILYGGIVHPPGTVLPYDPEQDPNVKFQKLVKQIVQGTRSK